MDETIPEIADTIIDQVIEDTESLAASIIGFTSKWRTTDFRKATPAQLARLDEAEEKFRTALSGALR